MLPQRVLALTRTEGRLSRSALATKTGMSKAAVTSAVQLLLERGLLSEVGYAESSGGRRATLLEFNARAGFVIGLDVGGTQARAVLADLLGEVLFTIKEPTDGGSVMALVSQLAKLAEKLTHKAQISAAGVFHVAVGTPGVVDPVTQTVRYAPNLSVLEVPSFAPLLRARLPAPVTLHNDVNLAALGEKWRGAGQEADTLLLLSVGTGLGMGIVQKGELFVGRHGRAGEIGYAPTAPGTDLEATLSGAGLAARHLERGGSGDTFTAFAEYDAGLEPGLSVVQSFLELLARTLCLLITTFDPDLLILSGGVGQRCGAYLPTLRQAMRDLLPFTAPVLLARLEDQAGLLGAVAVALRQDVILERLLEGGGAFVSSSVGSKL